MRGSDENLLGVERSVVSHSYWENNSLVRSDEIMASDEKAVGPYSFWTIMIGSDKNMKVWHVRRQLVHILIG